MPTNTVLWEQIVEMAELMKIPIATGLTKRSRKALLENEVRRLSDYIEGDYGVSVRYGKFNNLLKKKLQRRMREKIKKQKDDLERLDNEFNEKVKVWMVEGKYNDITNGILDGRKMKMPIAIQLYNLLSVGKHTMTITLNTGITKIIMINQTTRKYMLDLLTQGMEYEKVEQYGSDTVNSMIFKDIVSLDIQILGVPEKVIKNKNGRFFPYLHNTTLDLKMYQIFTQSEAYNEKLVSKRDHCLIHSLVKLGFGDAEINTIKLNIKSGWSLSKKWLKDIVNVLKKDIRLYFIEERDNREKVEFNTIKCDGSDGSYVSICLYQEHYFVFEDTPYSKFSIEHYDEVKSMGDWERIVRVNNKNDKKYYERRDDTKISSLMLVHTLFKANKFERLDMVKFAENGTGKLKDYIYLDNIDNEQIPFKREPKIRPVSNIVYADCETFTTGHRHELFLLGFVGTDNDECERLNYADYFKLHGNQARKQMTNKLLDFATKGGTVGAIIYFHNVKYDNSILEPYLNVSSKVIKNNQLYSLTCGYKGKMIEIRDSLKMIPFRLCQFAKEFNLPEKFKKQEAIAYEYYTEQNMNDSLLPVETYKKFLSNDDYPIFEDNLKANVEMFEYDEVKQIFNPIKYYDYYLMYDCLVLKYGFMKFNVIIKDITKNAIDVYDYLTVSSLTDNYMRIRGVYDDVWEVSGNLRSYIAKAVYGGRVLVNPKYVKKVIEGKISDYDGVSLYPSAIKRLCDELGLPVGKAQRLNKDDLMNWDTKSYAIITIKITKINKKQQMPFICVRNDNGGMDYVNYAPAGEMVVDSITLKDYMNFHNIEFTISDGVYWNDGYNKKMGGVIQELFNARVANKKNEALANTLKLMLNSSYGKNIMKKSFNTVKIVAIKTHKYDKIKKVFTKIINPISKFNNYIYNNFNTVKSYRQINDRTFEIDEAVADKSYNRGHIGCSILSMSKRIMNEVFDVANDNNFPIYYTDTDSLHIDCVNVLPLETKFEERYGRALNGGNLGQFHTDFKLKGAVGDIYAVVSIFLGKKSYMDKLEGFDADGKKLSGYHIRLKGITPDGILYESRSYEDDYLGLYKYLALSNTKIFTLNPAFEDENRKKTLFEYVKGAVRTRAKFTRSVKF